MPKPAPVLSRYFRFNARATAGLKRSALLERLLARADGESPVHDWRADAFRMIAPGAAEVPAVASVAFFADQGATHGAWVYLATPVHYTAEMSNVRLAANGLLSLSQGDAAALAADFNRVWAGSGIRLTAGRSGALYALFDEALEAITRDPADVIDRHIEAYLPSGADAPRLRQLMSEAEMWLFEHAVNGGRVAQGFLPVTGLWLWGGGPLLAALPPVRGWCAGDDVFFDAFKKRSPPRSTAALRADIGSSGVDVLSQIPGTPAWAQAESSLLKPALQDLRSGNIARLELSAGDHCFRVSAYGSRRFWRRLKPWWEYFE